MEDPHADLVAARTSSKVTQLGQYIRSSRRGAPPLSRSAIICFRKACEFGPEGLVSKHRDRPYRGGSHKYCIKVKNRKRPAMNRVMDVFASQAGTSVTACT